MNEEFFRIDFDDIQKQLKITQQDLANIMGIARETLSKYKNNHLKTQTIPLVAIRKLAQKFNLDLNALFNSEIKTNIEIINNKGANYIAKSLNIDNFSNYLITTVVDKNYKGGLIECGDIIIINTTDKNVNYLTNYFLVTVEDGKEYILQLIKNKQKILVIDKHSNTNYELNNLCKIKGKVTHVIKSL